MKNTVLIYPALVCCLLLRSFAADGGAEMRDIAVSGGVQDGKARLTIEGWLTPPTDRTNVVFAAVVHDTVGISQARATQNLRVTLDVIEGRPGELALTLNGDSEVREVTGDIRDWGVRQDTNGTRVLVLRPRGPLTNSARIEVSIVAELKEPDLGRTVRLLSIAPPNAALLSGYVTITSTPDSKVELDNASGLLPIEPKYLPEAMRTAGTNNAAEPLAFRFQGERYRLSVKIDLADPESRQVVLRNFQLAGAVTNDTVSFAFAARARVSAPQGGKLELLSGAVALTSVSEREDWRLSYENGVYWAVFDKPGDYPIELEFDASLRNLQKSTGVWRGIRFKIATAAVAPLRLRGLAGETEFELAQGGRPARQGAEFVAHVPADGQVDLAWKQAGTESEGKLFFAAEMLAQITVSPGLMRQAAVLDVRVMQGELSQLPLVLSGQGEVTRVQGEHVLSWDVTPGAKQGERILNVRFNQALKDQFSLQVQAQTPLGAFPSAFDALKIQPRGATRFAGFVRIANEGAVRLEVARATGLTQVAPEQFPETDTTRTLLRAAGGQRFVYRFSGGETALSIQADQISPEIAASQILTYRLAENELSIEAEIELDVREAPLRELWIRIPRGYGIAKLTASGLSDYFVSDATNSAQSELRLVYGAPVSGRQLIQLRLEQNRGLGEAQWDLPPIAVLRAKSTRGHIGVAAEAGFRLTPERTQNLNEIATAFFPRKVAGLQTAFRVNEESWQAVMRVTRLPQSIQADVMHLFSIGEGIAYGSSVITYNISGAPTSAFRVELSDEYFNVEFSGKDVRAWQKTNGVYLVQLHTPVSGAYSLLASYERPFKAQGETLTFSGARPLDAQSEQGHTLVVSAYQFDVKPTEVSANLLRLETGEVPAEYRLFFDAPILAAYRYTARPFNLRLTLSPLAQGDSLNQVVDRASLVTRISKEGQVITDAKYFVKNRGNPQFRVSVPPGSELWSASVNGAPVVPVVETNASLIPLPQQADPNSPLTLELKLASRAKNASRVTVSTPRLAAPVMLAEWRLEPDTGQSLRYLRGTLTPALGVEDNSGFAQLRRTLRLSRDGEGWLLLVGGLALWAAASLIWRRAVRNASLATASRASVPWLVCLGAGAALIGCIVLLALADMTTSHRGTVSGVVTLLAPVQQANSGLEVELANVEAHAGGGWLFSYGWPALLGLAMLAYSLLKPPGFGRQLAAVLGWLFLAWATLRWPNGAPLFIGLLVVFLLVQVAAPIIRTAVRLNRRKPVEPPSDGMAAATTLMLLTACLSCGANAQAADSRSRTDKLPPIADTLRQEIRVEDKYVRGIAKFQWKAERGELLTVLSEPGVLTRGEYPTNGLKLVRTSANDRAVLQMLAERDGTFEGTLHYELQTTAKDGQNGFTLPTGPALVNEVTVTVANTDVRIVSPQAVSTVRRMDGSNTVTALTLAPAAGAWIHWAPRARDIKGEKSIFYADLTQLYAPAAGVVEGAHLVSIRPAQGEIGELTFEVPRGATITDVQEISRGTNQQANQAANRANVTLWRFDPDARRLRVSVNPPQSRPFTLLVRSQVATAPLPFEQSLGLLVVEGSAGQIGYVGIASGAEVQLDSVAAAGFAAINLEDFPAEAAAELQTRVSGVTVRRAFRYTDPRSTLSIKAGAVEPDVRVETQQTLSMGEDRVVLAANATVSIARAGIFRLSFALPPGYDVESISSPVMSHWTEARSNDVRIITLHLKGKTEGQQQFAVTLAGPGARATNAWAVPQFSIREAGKERGTLILAPEQGIRLQAGERESLTQLDPQRSGIPQKGVLAFRILQTPWRLTVAVEKVDAWVQLTSLQHVTVTEAQLKIAANLQYQIDNTGLKDFRVLLPTNAENVQITGDQISDTVSTGTVTTNGLRAWDVKLHRRVIGGYRLRVAYQLALPPGASEARIRGIEAADVNSHRGYFAVQSAGRLQARAVSVPDTLQPMEWQSVPKALLQDLRAEAANHAYRLVEPSFEVVVTVERREAAKLLPARVNSINLNSVVADDGAMLTQAKLEILPGDKRLLNLTLPPGGSFWFAFVNQNGVWPWRDGDKILIPLEQQSRGATPVQVEVFYTAPAGKATSRRLDLSFAAPKFDLPLENITWRVILSEKWKVDEWSGSLQLEQFGSSGSGSRTADATSYLQSEASIRQERSREAEQLLAIGNNALQQGDPQQARRAFQSAFGLSTHDAAFNEDARVQLQNVKVQQALIGLNFRNDAVVGPSASTGKLAELKSRQDFNYTQQDAKEILERNTAEDNAALMKQAERIIQQQDAAVSSPAAIRASIPEQGRVLSFKRAVAVDPWADLRLHIEAKDTGTARGSSRLGMLVLIALGIAVFAWFGRPAQTNRLAV